MPLAQFKKFADLVTFTRASTATYVDKDGILKTAGNNVPRFSYDTTGSNPITKGLLIEKVTTNEWTNQVDDLTNWIRVNTVQESTVLPTGLTGTAFRLKKVIGQFSFGRMLLPQKTGKYFISCFAKKVTGSGMPKLYTGKSGLLYTSLIGTPTDGILSGHYVGNGWWRMYSVINDPVGNTGFGWDNSISDTDPEIVDTYIWGIQLEKDNPTTFYPTVGAAASRAKSFAAVQDIPFDNFFTGAGTFLFDFELIQKLTTKQYVFSITDFVSDAALNRIECWIEGNAFNFKIIVDNVQAGQVIQIPFTQNKNRIVVRLSPRDYAISINGAVPVINSTEKQSALMNFFNLGSSSGGNFQMHGFVQRFDYTQSLLTNEQIQKVGQGTLPLY